MNTKRIVNPTGGRIRTDRAGLGSFGALRTTPEGVAYHHAGLDLLGRPGQEVRAPIAGVVTRQGYVHQGETRWRLVEIRGEDLTAKLMYARLGGRGLVGVTVAAGDVVASLQDITERGTYRAQGMRTHLHLEITDRASGEKIDPAPLVFAVGEDITIGRETYYAMLEWLDDWRAWHLEYQDVLPGEALDKSAALYERSMAFDE